MKKQSFFRKILLINILPLVCITGILFVGFAFYFVRENTRSFQKNVKQNTETVANLVEENIFLADNTSLQLGYSPYIKEMLVDLYIDRREENYFDKEPIKKMNIVNHMMPYLIKEAMIYRILIYNKNGDYVVGGEGITDNEIKKYMDVKMPLWDKYFIENREKVIYEVYEEDILQNIGKSISGYIALIRPLKDGSNIIGYIEVHIPLKGVEKQIRKLGINQNVTILNENEAFLYLETKENLRKTYLSSILLENGFEIQVCDAEDGGRRIVFVTVIAMMVLLVAIVISMFILQRKIIIRITAPLISLFQTIKNTDLDELKKIEEDNSLDELQELQQTFHKMMESLKNSVDIMVVMRTEKMNAQLLALQAQIEPHFIHNTLTVISSLVDEGKTEKAKGVCQKLSSLIRYSSDYRQKAVVLHEEINNSISYLELLRYRYEEDFSYEVKVTEECRKICVPKFILQPLLENALKHSLKNADFPWKIILNGYIQNGTWIVEVIDDGIKIEKEKIEDLKSFAYTLNTYSTDELLKNLKIGGFSLKNTLMRMYIHDPTDLFFDIYGNDYGGTTVAIGGKVDDSCAGGGG